MRTQGDTPSAAPRASVCGLAFHNRDTAALCLDCRRGQVVPREIYYACWLERSSAEGCALMARRSGDTTSAIRCGGVVRV